MVVNDSTARMLEGLGYPAQESSVTQYRKLLGDRGVDYRWPLWFQQQSDPAAFAKSLKAEGEISF